MRESILDKYGLDHINVTHISQQFWCERQVELSLQFPRQDTEESIAGTDIHKDLMLELVNEISVGTMKREDEVYAGLLNIRTGLEQLLDEGMTRELKVFGRAAGFPVSGIVDQVSIKSGVATVLDHKTRKKPTLPPPPSMKTTEIQVMLYKKLLDDLRLGKYRYDDFIEDTGLDRLERISPEFRDELINNRFEVDTDSVPEMAKRVIDMYRALPEISEYIIVKYIHQDTMDHLGDRVVLYDEGHLEDKLKHAGKFWDSSRKACRVGFREKWKCNYCEYRNSLCASDRTAQESTAASVDINAATGDQ